MPGKGDLCHWNCFSRGWGGVVGRVQKKRELVWLDDISIHGMHYAVVGGYQGMHWAVVGASRHDQLTSLHHLYLEMIRQELPPFFQPKAAVSRCTVPHDAPPFFIIRNSSILHSHRFSCARNDGIKPGRKGTATDSCSGRDFHLILSACTR